MRIPTFLLIGKKCQFMLEEGIIHGHKISWSLEVDNFTIKVIEKLPPSINIKGARNFLVNTTSFNRRFIKSFAKYQSSYVTFWRRIFHYVFTRNVFKLSRH